MIIVFIKKYEKDSQLINFFWKEIFNSHNQRRKEVIFGEVSSGLGPFGFPAATKKKKYVDKIKLSVIMRDALNKILKGWNFVPDEQRKKLVVFGWT